MKKRVMNIRPQEVTTNGERSVQYKGSDGKMHDVSAKLPQDAVIPVAHRTVIAAGETITLAQAHTIEGFDFNKVSALSFGEGYNSYSGFYVNVDDSGERYLTYLEYAYPGKPRVMFNKEGSEYTAFNGGSYNTFLEFASNEIEASQSAIAEALLEIARQTGFLEIYKYSNYVFVPNFYEEVVLLTLAEDIVTSEEFFMPKASGGLVKLATVSEEEGEEQSSEEPFPYRLQNNPNAYELIIGPTVGVYQTYKAVTCDGTNTEISATQLYEKLLNDPYTVVIFKDTRPGSSGTCTAILHIAQHDESSTCIRLNGELLGNTKATYNAYVYGGANDNRISMNKSTT